MAKADYDKLFKNHKGYRRLRLRQSIGIAFSMIIGAGMISPPAAQADGLGYDGLPPQELCGLCHGLNGLSATAKFPRLAGQKADYIEKQLQDFLNQRRTNDGGQMVSIVTEIKPAQFKAAARHFAQQPPPKPDLEAISELPANAIETARKLFTEGRPDAEIPACISCHSDRPSHKKLTKNSAVPLLTSQHQRYLAKQLRDFKSGERGNDVTGTMPAIAAKLSEGEIEIMAAYLAAQPRNGG